MKKYYIDSLGFYEIENEEMNFNDDEDSSIIWFETNNIKIYADCSQDVRTMLRRIYYIVSQDYITDNALNNCTLGEIVDNIIDCIGGDEGVFINSLM